MTAWLSWDKDEVIEQISAERLVDCAAALEEAVRRSSKMTTAVGYLSFALP